VRKQTSFRIASQVFRDICANTDSDSRLKLKLYRTLGIDVEADPTTGEYNKAIIRNATKGDVHVVNIDPKFSRHFYTNYFWRTM
jgi:kinetochore protein Spc24